MYMSKSSPWTNELTDNGKMAVKRKQIWHMSQPIVTLKL